MTTGAAAEWPWLMATWCELRTTVWLLKRMGPALPAANPAPPTAPPRTALWPPWPEDEAADACAAFSCAAAADAFVAVLVAPCRLLAEALEAVVQDDLRARRRRDSHGAPCGQQHLPLIQTVIRNLRGGVVAQRRRGAAGDGVEERWEPVAHVEE